RWDAFNRKRDAVLRETQRLQSTWVHPSKLTAADAERLLGKAIEHEYSLADLLRRPGIDFNAVTAIAAVATSAASAGVVSRETLQSEFGELMANAVIEQVEISIKYAGYIDKQLEEVERVAYYENLALPTELDYSQVPALSFEVRQTLNQQRPATLGQASRMSGVTPAAISLLLVHLKKSRSKGFGGSTVKQKVPA
ncbi:MAG: tRNA uridine-5-carboxymethylaminomethyl(34) synthesis enzyme MnmG, partial [Pseudorhodobacter sp.]|nr:tRNA uridine-5-carboxymethylaminomethyl(34) synthesis enzyme MnmG [Rhizobacter sp.]